MTMFAGRPQAARSADTGGPYRVTKIILCNISHNYAFSA